MLSASVRSPSPRSVNDSGDNVATACGCAGPSQLAVSRALGAIRSRRWSAPAPSPVALRQGGSTAPARCLTRLEVPERVAPDAVRPDEHLGRAARDRVPPAFALELQRVVREHDHDVPARVQARIVEPNPDEAL